MTLNTFNRPDTMLDIFIHSFIVIYLTFIECLPGTPSVRDATVNKTASAFKEFMISLGTQIKEQAKIVHDATTGEPDLVLGRSSNILICGPGMPSFHLPLCLVIAYSFLIP